MRDLEQPLSTGTDLLRNGEADRRASERPPGETEESAAEVARLREELARARREVSERSVEVERLIWELGDTHGGVRALYRELEEKAETLRRASELKSRFLANMSHEFRTPLSSILSLSRLLLDRADGELTEEQERQTTYIRKSAEALFELVSDLLDLAQIEAGKSVVRAVEFEVDDLFGALRGMIRPLVTSGDVRLVFAEPPSLPPLYTDEGKVSQILRNFIANALKFTERGEICVTASPGADVSSIIFAVRDTGIGIAPEDQERIFAEFTQIDGPLQQRVKGTGLGLPLCRKLAELLGGGVSLASGRGVGSTFSASIPRVYPGAICRAPVRSSRPR